MDSHESLTREQIMASAIEDATGCLLAFFDKVRHEQTGWVLEALTILQNAAANTTGDGNEHDLTHPDNDKDGRRTEAAERAFGA